MLHNGTSALMRIGASVTPGATISLASDPDALACRWGTHVRLLFYSAKIRIEKTKELIDYAGKDKSCVCFTRNSIV
jgi:hypothetical protein